jgi:hypothetical protein
MKTASTSVADGRRQPAQRAGREIRSLLEVVSPFIEAAEKVVFDERFEAHIPSAGTQVRQHLRDAKARRR